jgi:mRNA-degrading endonuclease RelE of RelBE toxin-antitoxin system
MSFTVDDEQRVIQIYKIGHRREVYTIEFLEESVR